MRKLKKFVYVALFMLLGVLVGFIVHAVAEIWYAGLLILNFKKYGRGLSWVELYFAHQIISFLFVFLGAVSGYLQGLFWWKVVYGKRSRH
ncbi:MAG: hypothetical protein WC788_06015 [Candidatus Paceibacterota bacterium]|jgi:hypothetical protein